MIEAISSILNQGLAYAVPMFILLGLLIFVHELGHFLAAKYYKVKVETFSLGFGPKIIKFVKGGTVYCISALPLGGYVKMYGDEPGKDIPIEQQRQSYLHKPVGQRIIIALAGPLMNLFFAALLFFMIAWIGDKSLSPIVGEISNHSTAYKVGFRSYDKILQIDDRIINTWENVESAIEDSANKKTTFKIERMGQAQDLQVTPELSENDNLFSTAQKIGKVKGLTSNLHLPIIGVLPGGSFDKAGFQTGDRIIKINDIDVEWYRDIEPMVLESLFSSQQSTEVTLRRYQDFRKKNEYKDSKITLNPNDFTQHDLGLFIPETVIAEVQDKSPAQAAGLQRLDQIKSINGVEVYSFNDIIKNVSSYKQGDQPLQIEIIRMGELISFNIKPKMNSLEGKFGETENRFTIGVIPTVFIAPQTFLWKSTTLSELSQRTVEQTIRWTNVTLLSFVRILQQRVSSKNVGGIVSIGMVAKESWSVGANAFLKIMAIISINLFILNLLPIPILDGGHLVLFTLEAIKGAPISLRKVEMAQQVGFLIILFLMAFALFNDFSRILGS